MQVRDVYQDIFLSKSKNVPYIRKVASNFACVTTGRN